MLTQSKSLSNEVMRGGIKEQKPELKTLLQCTKGYVDITTRIKATFGPAPGGGREGGGGLALRREEELYHTKQ